ncbi:unnamed protein product [Heligmosomoides polygyrus]|uniref:Reverse transcriptase domain-containing protein n=1 Tax=Heligmosomoides polygyrus TaxID=6339 RepID=A0A183FTK6_HELPZ|nr:unnamed protein product [Heligmosomoides polygyrus]
MKIYKRLVDSRLREMVPISQVQWGFMPERSTTDAIFIARQVMEKYREKRKPCYLAFLDLEKAYDRPARALARQNPPENTGTTLAAGVVGGDMMRQRIFTARLERRANTSASEWAAERRKQCFISRSAPARRTDGRLSLPYGDGGGSLLTIVEAALVVTPEVQAAPSCKECPVEFSFIFSRPPVVFQPYQLF